MICHIKIARVDGKSTNDAHVLGDVTCGGDKLMYSCCSIGGNLAMGSIGVRGSTSSEKSSVGSSVGIGGRLSG